MEKDLDSTHSLAFSLLNETNDNEFLSKFSNKNLLFPKDAIGFDYPEKQNLEPISASVSDVANFKNDETVELLDISMKKLPPDLGLNQAISSNLFVNCKIASQNVQLVDSTILSHDSSLFTLQCDKNNNYNHIINNDDNNININLSNVNININKDINDNEVELEQAKDDENSVNEKRNQDENIGDSLDIDSSPTLFFDRNVVSQFEINSLPEFFSGKYDRTHFYPYQYLIIRNIFLDEWESRKPQPIRFRDVIRLNRGIGNVVSFSRVCKFLTAIGAINNKVQVKMALTKKKKEIKSDEKVNEPFNKNDNQLQFISSEFKKNRKRKSYYLNEMGRLDIDPIRCGFIIPQSEIENVISVFSNKKFNGYDFKNTSHFSSSSAWSKTQIASPNLKLNLFSNHSEESTFFENKQCNDKPILGKIENSKSLSKKTLKNDVSSSVHNSFSIPHKTNTLVSETINQLTDSSVLCKNSKIHSKSKEPLEKQTVSPKLVNNVNNLNNVKVLESMQNLQNLNHLDYDSKIQVESLKSTNAKTSTNILTLNHNQDSINANDFINSSNLTKPRSVSNLSNGGIIKSSRTRPNPFKLIPCESYGCNTEAPFSLCLSVEALTIIDVHSHCVQTEVIGLLGGLFCSTYRQLNILTAEPCESLTASTTDLQCEMDPVSQADASERLAKSGYQVVGWYHSHPTFVPNPSLRDLETQAKYQELFAEGNKPFLALILNPYCTTNQSSKTSFVSKYKCLMLSDQFNSQVDYRTPYAFNPILVRKDRLFYNLTVRLKELCAKIEGKPSTFCLTNKVKGKDTQYLQKLMLSLKHHMELTGLSNKEIDILLEQIKEILLSHLKNKTGIK